MAELRDYIRRHVDPNVRLVIRATHLDEPPDTSVTPHRYWYQARYARYDGTAQR